MRVVTKDRWETREQDFPRATPIERQLRFLLRYAILAPSTRNTQPWRFTVEANTVQLFADPERAQPVSDRPAVRAYLAHGHSHGCEEMTFVSHRGILPAETRVPQYEVIMRTIRLAAALAALVLSPHLVAAQQPAPSPRPDRTPSGMMAAQMQRMDSLNTRLDTLVGRMNRATGNRKVTAMADVINELVAQRKVMQDHMRRMMESRKGMMHMMGEAAPEGRPAPTPRTDSTPADTAGHAEHHPPD